MLYYYYDNVLINLKNERYKSKCHLQGERDWISTFFWSKNYFSFVGRIMENHWGINSGRRTSLSQSEPAASKTFPLVFPSWIVSHKLTTVLIKSLGVVHHSLKAFNYSRRLFGPSIVFLLFVVLYYYAQPHVHYVQSCIQQQLINNIIVVNEMVEHNRLNWIFFLKRTRRKLV